MQKLFYIGILTGLLCSTSCQEQSVDEEATQKEEVLPVAADRMNTGVIKEDSALQTVEEVTLKVTGNTLEEIAYSKDTIEVPTDALVKLEFINEGTELPMIHNFVVTKAGNYKAVALAGEKIGSSGNYIPPDAELLAVSPLALPGQTVVVEFKTPPKPGVYDFGCTYPEHWKMMHGTLIVK